MKTIIKYLLFIIIVAVAFAAAVIFYGKTEKIDSAALSSAQILKTAPVPQPAFNPDSLSWKQAVVSAPWEGRDSQAVVVYKDKIWLMGGLDANKHVISPGNVDYGNAPHFSDVWSSEDGVNWQLVLEKAPWGDRRSIQVVDFEGKMWLMGGWGPQVGYKNDVWSSEDGVNWKLEALSAAWPAREGHQLIVFKNKIWLIGGVRYDKQQLFNDVWYSSDGINWTEATKNAAWSPRWDHAAGVFDNKLWVVDGMAFHDKLYNDVWSSEDGVNWSLVAENPPFATRQGNAILEYKNRLWVIGRLNIPLYGNGANDVWYSSDGVNWQKTKDDPLWTGREDVGVVIFKDKIWILAGMDKNWTWTNDVWFSTSNTDTNN